MHCQQMSLITWHILLIALRGIRGMRTHFSDVCLLLFVEGLKDWSPSPVLDTHLHMCFEGMQQNMMEKKAFKKIFLA